MLWSSARGTRLRTTLPVAALTAALLLGTTACLGLGDSSAAKTPVSEVYEEPDTTDAPETSTSSTTVAAAETVAATTTTTTSTTTTTTTLPPTTTTEVPPLEKALRAVGARSGTETKRLQERLLELGFWLESASGRYGLTTKQAVMAFQKYNGLKRTGKVDAETAKLMSEATERVHAKSTSGSLVEVDKDRQVLFVVRNGVTLFVLNTSTGNGQYFLETNQKTDGKYEAGRAITPSGKYKIHTQRAQGWWSGDLGKIYRPKYFNGGRAIHGMTNVPSYPASHGCVRVSLPAMDMLWTLDWLKWGLRVWVYGEDIPARNKPIPIPPSTSSTTTTTSPSSSSTSSSTTSTTTTTTAAPSPSVG